MKTKRFLAWFLTIAMALTMVPSLGITAFAADPVEAVQSDTKENQNQSGGIVYTKTSTAKSDGTVDITLTAHTKGEVRQTNAVSPTDIVLVLDVSGSMDESYTAATVTGYNPVTGTGYRYVSGWFIIPIRDDGYGLEDTDEKYYINTGAAQEPKYTRVVYTGRDANGFEMYEYVKGTEEIVVYPAVSGVSAAREHSYPVVQFYSPVVETQAVNKMESLKNAVKGFIETTKKMNEGLAAEDMHTISIVKFASDSYYNSTVPTITAGNHKGADGRSNYNYSEVVTGLTAVNEEGAASLEAAVDSLSPGGATAVDYGLKLAEAVLMNRSMVTEQSAVDRKEAVIVFTDGSPTHSDGFETNVANSSISVAKAMKDVGVKMYSVCIASDADSEKHVFDSSGDINEFMHYVSSNFPTATSMDSGGTGGSVDGGYYMTPGGTQTLEMIFESIIQDIDHPTVILGEEAAVVDTISPYFDIQGSAANVVLMTSARKSDGTWADPVADSSLSCLISPEGDRLTISGFDFDENYISATGRGTNGDFYGKRLVVSFTVVPDYDVIDKAAATLMDGILPTNSGFASLVDSDSAPAAEVETPELEAHQVVYKVDGTVVSTYNRFAGSDVAVDAVPTKAGHTFSGWTYPQDISVANGEFVMPNKDVEITGVFTPNKYKVEYVYSGAVPNGATDLSGGEYNGNPIYTDVPYGSEVTIAPDAQAQGYTFSGWSALDQELTVADGKFMMPDHDVTLKGSFTLKEKIKYQIIHYTETMTDGVYEEKEVENLTEDENAIATALPKYYNGFTYDKGNVQEVVSGAVTSASMLVLKLYYNRNEHKVTYSVTGDVPTPTPAIPQEKVYKFGETVTVADDASAPGYTFGGWKSLSTAAKAGETFVMPNNDVAFVGAFTANSDTKYKVEYYLENIEGSGFDLNVAEGYENTATTGTEVFANAKEFEGFEYDASNQNNKASGIVAGDGSLVLKRYYVRKSYTLSYAYENNNQPSGAPGLSSGEYAARSYKFGETVTVAEDLSPITGYEFKGWHSSGYTVTDDTPSFAMPARNVTLYGNFEPASGIKWKEEHYFEELDGTYPQTPKYSFEHTGTTGAKAKAEPIAEEAGFVFDDAYSGNIVSENIAADGSTVLKFHYKRLSYNVSYRYDPADGQPDGAPDLSSGAYALKAYKYGETVTIVDAPALTGYEFVGWYPEQSGVPNSGTFAMPAYDVVFEGDFNPRSDTVYTVKHYLQDANGSYPEPNEQNIIKHKGTTGEEVEAIPRSFAGYSYKGDKDGNKPVKGAIKPDGSLVLELYYDRETYTVTYYLTGHVPSGTLAPVDALSPYRHGAEVSVLPTMSPEPGYTFVGWLPVKQSEQESTVTISNGKFTMPMHNVRLEGRYVANSGIPYIVRHWTQKSDLTGYELYADDERTGTADEPVTVYALTMHGFTDVTDYTGGTQGQQSATIKGDGTLAIDFYYDRSKYDIKYEYEGKLPEQGMTPPTGMTDVPFGTKVTVEPKTEKPGYTFNGWTTEDVTVEGDGTFLMPYNDVTFKGSFSSNIVDYTVNFFLQNIDAGDTFNPADYTLQEDVSGTGYTYKEQAYVGQLVQSRNQTFEGFTLNRGQSTWQAPVTVDADGNGNLVLNLYFDRHMYNITYAYYGEQPAGVNPLPDLTGRNKINVRYGKELSVEDTPVFAGYAFDGWYTRTATVDNGKFKMPNHDVEFLGRFVQQFNVVYDLNGGTGAAGVDYSGKAVKANENITVNAAPTRSGYNFNGWKEGQLSFNPGDTVKVDRHITFAAQWTPTGGGGGGGGTVVKNTLTYETNGGNKIPDEKHSPNKTVQLTKIPKKDGYVFEGWYLDSALTEYVKSVKMTKDVTVYAAWVEDNGSAGNGHQTPDSLNHDDHFAYIVGYPDGTVRPDANIDRAEVTSIFFRLLKDGVRNANIASDNGFNDVNAGDWHNKAISTMTRLGIVKGRYADRFVPDAPITRAEFAVICARFDNSEFEIADEFKDINGHWAENEIHEAAAHGWIKGYEDGSFRPDRFITRAEAMTMINRVLNRVPETAEDLLDSMVKWPDNSDADAWYYIAVQEATNGHTFSMKNHIYEKWNALTEVKDWTLYQ